MNKSRNAYVSLTFDDGPCLGTTRALVAALAAGHARATFFVRGDHAQRHPEQLRAIASAGMWFGNHGFSHNRLSGLSESAVRQELAACQRAVVDVVGRAPILFRPPFGETDDTVRTAARSLGLTEVLWTVDTRDWAGASTMDIVDAAASAEPGDVILLHDGLPATVDAVPFLLRLFANRGLRTGRIDPGTGRAVSPRARIPVIQQAA